MHIELDPELILNLLYMQTFASKITSGVASSDERSSNFKDAKHSLFVNIRRYRGLKTGYGVISKAVTYEPFKLSLTFREAPPDELQTSEAITASVNSSMLLVISATPVKSVYKSE